MIFVLLIFIGMYVKNKPQHYDLVILAFLCIITYFATNKPDFEAYASVYNHIAAGNLYDDTGIGWYYLCLAGSKLNLTYKVFEIIVLMISFLLIRRTVNYYILSNKESAMVWSLFLIYPALLDCTQIRFFIAEAIIIWALPFLIEKSKKGIAIYIISVFIAFTIHSSAILYLIFLMALVFEKLRKVTVGLIVIASLIAILGKSQLIKIASIFLNNLRLTRYFYSGNGVGKFGIVAYIATLILIYCIAKNCFYVSQNIKSVRLKKYYAFFFQASILICLVLPLASFDTNFFRIQRPFWLLMYIAIAGLKENNILYLEIYRGQKIKSKTAMLAISLFGNIFYISIFTYNIIQAFLI